MWWRSPTRVAAASAVVPDIGIDMVTKQETKVESLTILSGRHWSPNIIAERLSMRQLILQCGAKSQLEFVCMYECLYLYVLSRL